VVDLEQQVQVVAKVLQQEQQILVLAEEVLAVILVEGPEVLGVY